MTQIIAIRELPALTLKVPVFVFVLPPAPAEPEPPETCPSCGGHALEHTVSIRGMRSWCVADGCDWETEVIIPNMHD